MMVAMANTTTDAGGNAFAAGLRAFLCVGMGHLYLRRVRSAWLLLGTMQLLFFATFIGWAYADDTFALAVAILAAGFWLGQIIRAVRLARRTPSGAPLPEAAAGKSTARSLFRSCPAFYVAAWLIALVIGRAVVKPFVLETITYRGDAMVPSLRDGDHVFVTKLGSRSTHPERGDLVYLRDWPQPGHAAILRIIGVPADQIQISGEEVRVNGAVLRHQACASELPAARCVIETSADGISYAIELPDGTSGGDPQNATVPGGHYFVLPDNRDDSLEQSVGGAVPASHIAGRVTRIWWSSAGKHPTY